MRIVHWFRRDLRLDDNTALIAALQRAERVVPVFVLDPAILNRPDTAPARVAFLIATLRALDGRLREHGSRLLVLRGDPVTEVPRLVSQVGAAALTFNRDHEPYARRRDAAVAAAARAGGCEVDDHADALLTEPGTVLKDTGEPYTVFTPFKRRALEVLAERWRSPEEACRWLGHLCPADDLPAGVALPPPPATTVALPPAGEAAAWARLNRFTEGPLHAYAARRDFPGIDGTARLSPALTFGVISIRRCFQVARRARAAGPGTSPDGPDTWISELLWRDFYGHILHHFPRVETTAFQERMAALAWEERDDWLAAWQAGRTGYPMVDAGMRQLLAEGWMHNRARMIVGSFLCKDLLLNWQHGERHFMRHLIDGDLAANNGGWQWVASTGTDAQPSFRVFNPTGQGRRFDPDGAYIRRYVPELARVPDEHIHAPSQMPPGVQRAAGCAIGHDYPAPIVDHAVQRDRALALYRLTRAGQPGEAVARPRRSGHGRGTVPAG